MKPYLILFGLILCACGSGPKGSFSTTAQSDAPDYSKEENWSALPWKKDSADETPQGLIDKQDMAEVDVFYVHPTTHFGKEHPTWNAPINDVEMNRNIDVHVVRNQATPFNHIGKIYAPRYRQAVYQAYFSKDTVSAKKAFDLAYEDVKNAFGYYMSHWNKGRPFIIVSHSQGTTHMARLIEELIDGKRLEKKMIAAYLIGIPVDLDRYESLGPCTHPDDTNCLIGWRSWAFGSQPKLLKKEKGRNVLNVNPLSWTTDTLYVGPESHKGSVLIDFNDTPIPGTQNAQLHHSILWTNKPKFKGSALMLTKNYHRGDINLFYMNIRENATQRVNTYIGLK